MVIEPAQIKKILVINLAFIGDVLLSTPVTRALKEAYPHARLDMLTVPLTAPIARGNPYVSNVIAYDKRGRHRKITELWQLVRRLRAERYDLAVTTNFAPRGAMLAWAAGIRCRVGYDAQHAGLFLTYKAGASRPFIRHEAEYSLEVLKPLAITTGDTSLAFHIDPIDAQTMRGKVGEIFDRPIVLICPAGSYPQKSWTISGYAGLIKLLAPIARCLLIGGGADAPFLAEINRESGGLAGNLAGVLTLGELAALTAAAKLLVTVDTGPMHIAGAVGTPVVALFGPTDPRIWGPRGSRDVVIQARADCSPCWGKKTCPAEKCLSLVQLDEVTSAVLSILKDGGNAYVADCAHSGQK